MKGSGGNFSTETAGETKNWRLALARVGLDSDPLAVKNDRRPI